MKFQDLKVRDWFEYQGKLYQKMRQLNSSNAYCFTDGDYAWMEPAACVTPATSPRHMAYELQTQNALAYMRAAVETLEGARL